jgi:hypothetical protein
VKAFFIAIFGLIVTSAAAQGQCSINNTSFRSGESANYNVYYHLGFIWLHAAEVSFKTEPIVYKGKNAYHFTSIGKTLPNYNWIYEVNDRFESKADSATLNPFWFFNYTSEGGKRSTNTYQFDSPKEKIYIQTQADHSPAKNDTLSLKGCVFDLLTAIYACRNFDFDEKKVNDTIPLNLLIDDKIYPLHLRYLGKEEISTSDSLSYSCQKFSILLVEGTIFNAGENMFVWVTNDKARIPIRIEAKILIGSIVANLISYKGNKWPLNSGIKH